MSQMANSQIAPTDMLPGQMAQLGTKFYYKELDGKLVPLYTKDDLVTAGLSALGDDELQPEEIRFLQELVYPPRHIKTEDVRSLADIPHQSSVTPAPSRASTARVEHRPYMPTTMGSLGVKKYCTHWLRTGECDFNQQGCLFEHIIPDSETMFGTLGFKTIPRWIRESGQNLPFAEPAPPVAPAPAQMALPQAPSSVAGPPNMIMGRQSYRPSPHGPPQPGSMQRYGGNQRNTVGPSSRPYPVQSYRPNYNHFQSFRGSAYRPVYSRNVPPYSPMLPQPAGYLGRSDMALGDRSRAPSPAQSDYSIASANSFMQWQPNAVPARAASIAPSFRGSTPALTPGGYSTNSSPGTPVMQSGVMVPGPSNVFAMPRAPVPHIEHRQRFVGKTTGGEHKEASAPAAVEKEEGEITEAKGDLLDYQ